MLEKTLQRKMLKALKPFGWFYKASDMYRAGVPDILGCSKERFYAFELKTKTIATPLQIITLQELSQHGVALVVKYDIKHGCYKAKDQKFDKIEELVKWLLNLKLDPLPTNESVSTLRKNVLITPCS